MENVIALLKVIIKNNMLSLNWKMFVQSCICQVSIKISSTKFLKVSNFDFIIVSVSLVVNITSSEVAITVLNNYHMF